jgi:hypothetical protein
MGSMEDQEGDKGVKRYTDCSTQSNATQCNHAMQRLSNKIRQEQSGARKIINKNNEWDQKCAPRCAVYRVPP